jgi:hypothetical protein
MDAHTASGEETPVSHHLDTPLAAQTGQRARDFPYVVPA